ncbi:hypothetical protein PCL_08370 [Purpureocillium lilacinum]|uniref:Uncharacterized protein n=1 Tax=Purpureocillium lilacinum TaxID=33203 RepID=A0A2U3DRX1_PURLI|nr:hypothetical protein PCL_08370 [Purpureocillium lilacinum]
MRPGIGHVLTAAQAVTTLAALGLTIYVTVDSKNNRDHGVFKQSFKVPILERRLLNPLQTIEAKATEIAATVAAEATQLPDKAKEATSDVLRKVVPTGASLGTLRACVDVNGAKCINFKFLLKVLWGIPACLVISSLLCASTYLTTRYWEDSERDKRSVKIACTTRQWASTFLSVGGWFSSILMFLLVKEILDAAEDLGRMLPGTLERGFAHKATVAIMICATLHLVVTPLFYNVQHGRYNSANLVETKT